MNDFMTPLWTTEWGKRAGQASMVSMCLLLVYCIGSTGLSWYRDATLTRHSASVKSTETIKNRSNDLSALSSLHLFGYAPEQNTVLPVTSLQLRLVGVMQASGKEGVSSVLISEGGKPAAMYRVGEILPVGVKVQGITRDGVVLENGGRLEKLPLQRPALQFQGLPKSTLEN